MIRKQATTDSYTKKYLDHINWIYRYKLVCIDNKLIKFLQIYRSENVIYELVIILLEEIISFKKYKKTKKELIMAKEDRRNFQMASKCHQYNQLYS